MLHYKRILYRNSWRKAIYFVSHIYSREQIHTDMYFFNKRMKEHDLCVSQFEDKKSRRENSLFSSMNSVFQASVSSKFQELHIKFMIIIRLIAWNSKQKLGWRWFIPRLNLVKLKSQHQRQVGDHVLLVLSWNSSGISAPNLAIWHHQTFLFEFEVCRPFSFAKLTAQLTILEWNPVKNVEEGHAVSVIFGYRLHLPNLGYPRRRITAGALSLYLQTEVVIKRLQ